MQFIFGSRYRIYYFLVLNPNIRYKQKIRSNRRLAIVSDYLLLVEMAVIEAPATFAASQPSAFCVPFAIAKDGRCGFDYRIKKEKQPKFYLSVKLRLSILVEMAVIETASENPFTQLSPGAVSLLGFPQRHAE